MPVPSEFLGQARLFRNAVREADRRLDAALATVAAPIRRRLASGKLGLRRDATIDLARAWQESVSDAFTLRRVADFKSDGMTIAELRPVAGEMQRVDWESPDWERGIGLVWLSLQVADGSMRFRTHPVAHLLLHALARRYERGDGRAIADVMRDLRTLGSALDGQLDEIPVPPGGRWVGRWNPTRDTAVGRVTTMFHCQTFLT